MEQLGRRLSAGDLATLEVQFDPAQIVEFLEQLLVPDIRDNRADPEPLRRGRFQAGWEDFTIRRKKYDDLGYITWQNLGNRCGVRFGAQRREQIRAIYEIAAGLYLRAQQQTPAAESWLPEEIPEGATYSEGSVQQVLINRYERDPLARAACIARFGTECCVCRVDLVSIYGQAVAGFIHVHHLKELSRLGTDYQIDPERDLRPVCPNCHAVIHHRREPPYEIEDVQRFIQDTSGS